ncbi:MAG: hypothetical protein AAF916_06980 [Planctomycetota bacterium]
MATTNDNSPPPAGEERLAFTPMSEIQAKPKREHRLIVRDCPIPGDLRPTTSGSATCSSACSAATASGA